MERTTTVPIKNKVRMTKSAMTVFLSFELDRFSVARIENDIVLVLRRGGGRGREEVDVGRADGISEGLTESDTRRRG